MRVALGFLIVFSIPLGEAAAQERRWLCVADQSTGFAFRGGRWVQTNFYATKKIIVTHTKKGFEMSQLGSATKIGCYVDGEETNVVICLRGTYGFAESFVFNFAALKFVQSYTGGFVHVDGPHSDTPSLTLGRCSAF